MNLLIIGGTTFLGPALVAEALQSGHQVTLFNRGMSSREPVAGVELIKGDRETDLKRLAGRSWDAVIDTCGYIPRPVKLSAEALKGSVGHYTFVSTLSVYPLEGASNRDESAQLLSLGDHSVEAVTDETYGPLKVLCEAQVQAAFPEAGLIIRPGLIVGPRDPTNRFTHWVTRAARGGAAIAPPAEQPIQFVDARDLAAFTLRRIEAGASGIYNVTGPAGRLTFGELLPQVKQALASDVDWRHVGDDFLRAHEVGEFTGLPLWLKRALAESFMTFGIDKAIGHGLTFRSIGETVRDTFDWAKTLPADAPKPADLPRDKEEALLRAWRNSRSQTTQSATG